MSNFIKDGTDLPDPKTNVRPIPATVDRNKYVDSTDWNNHNTALSDIREYVESGTLYGFEEQASTPTATVVGSNASSYIWLKNDGTLYLHRNGTDTLVGSGGGSSAPFTALTPLSVPPTPLYNDTTRAMYCWNGGTFFANATTAQSIISFCGTYGVNMLFLSIYQQLSPAYWSTTNVNNVMRLVQAARASGIQCYALLGTSVAPYTQRSVMANVQNVVAYNKIAAQFNAQFDGLSLDDEYYTVSSPDYVGATIAYCDLLRNIKSMYPELKIAAYTSQFMILSGSGRPAFQYAGKTQTAGAHFYDACDICIVACLSNVGSTSVSYFAPWMTYAQKQGNNKPLLVSVSIDPPAGPTEFYGFTKSQMETQIQVISNTYNTGNTTNCPYMGLAIEAYYYWNLMAP